MASKHRIPIFLFRAAVAVLAAEIVCRVFAVPNLAPSEYQKRSIPFARSFFNSHFVAPGAADRSVNAEFYGARTYPLSTLGTRGAEHSVDKKPGVVRVLVLGASGLFDLSATGNQDWPAELETELSRRLKKPVEILNFGTPGALVIDLAIRVATDLYRFHPDYILLFDSWMEIKYFHIHKSLFEIPAETDRNYFTNYAGSLDRTLAENSRFFAFVRGAFLRYAYYGVSAFDPQGNLWIRKFPLEDGVPAAPLNQPTAMALAQYEQGVRLFVDASRNAGAVPILMSEPSLITQAVDPTTLETINKAFYEHFTLQGIIRCLEDIHRLLLKVAADTKSPLIDIDVNMNGRPEFFLDHVHVTDAGRRVLVKLTAEKLSAILSDPRVRPARKDF